MTLTSPLNQTTPSQLEPKELELRVHRSIANHIDDTMDIKTEGGEGAVTLLREKRFADLRCGGGFSLALTISGRVSILYAV